MPSINQLQKQKQQSSTPKHVRMVYSLWNSLNFTFNHIQDIEARGVTWVNDFQFLINIRTFSEYIRMNFKTVVNHLQNLGFLNAKITSTEIFDELQIENPNGWYLYMREGFTPNTDEDSLQEISSQL